MSKFSDCPIVWTFRSAHLFYLQKEEIPLVLWIFPCLFRLIRHLVGFRRDGMAQILLPGENVIQRLFRPVVPSVQLRAGVTSAASTPVAQFSNRQNLIIP